MNILVVSNAKAGSSAEDIVTQVCGEFENLGTVTHIQPPAVDAFDEDVVRAAADKEMVVVAGGDGTLNMTINALRDMHDEITFAVVPMGTGNDFARTLALSGDPLAAAKTVVAGEVKRFDLGRVSSTEKQRLFLNACMGGFPVAVNKAIDEETKKRLGPLAFWVGGIKAAVQLPQFEVEINGEKSNDIAAVGIGNGRTAGGGIPVFPEANPSDGLLEWCLFRVSSVVEGLHTAVKLKEGSHGKLENVRRQTDARIEVRSDPTLEFNVDGDLMGINTPVTFEIAGDIAFRIP